MPACNFLDRPSPRTSWLDDNSECSPGLSRLSEETLLPQIDSQIVDFVRESGKATAEDVQHKFNYKGKNGACARLNRLCDMNFLQKKQVGKKVFFMPTSY
jgi:hypothetical protein